jgi:hypothetical protein
MISAVLLTLLTVPYIFLVYSDERSYSWTKQYICYRVLGWIVAAVGFSVNLMGIILTSSTLTDIELSVEHQCGDQYTISSLEIPHEDFSELQTLFVIGLSSYVVFSIIGVGYDIIITRRDIRYSITNEIRTKKGKIN